MRPKLNIDENGDLEIRFRSNRVLVSVEELLFRLPPPNSRLSLFDISEIKRRLNMGETAISIAGSVGMSKRNIYRIKASDTLLSGLEWTDL